MATSIRTIQHTTSQRSNLVRFYRDGLGLGDPEHAGGEEAFRLGELALGISSGDARLHGPVPRTTLTFAVDDLEEKIAHLKALGVPFDAEPSSGGGASRRAICRDPDGNFVILLSGPRVARRSNDDDGRPSRKSRKAAKKSQKKASRPASKKSSKSAKKSGKKKKK
jgi:predicted enzyme related to lactoylglutathione lyase